MTRKNTTPEAAITSHDGKYSAIEVEVIRRYLLEMAGYAETHIEALACCVTDSNAAYIATQRLYWSNVKSALKWAAAIATSLERKSDATPRATV